ncbi:MAG: caspase family protein [Planctomycetes bacterium]|nr:caspase family protein [Planctomycetota bacterium]
MTKRILGAAMVMGLFLAVSCVSSERSLRQFDEKMTSERRVKTEDALGEPRIEIVQRPISSSPDVRFTVMADMVKRDSFLQQYQKTEKFEQVQSGEGLMIAGGIMWGWGLLEWMFGAIFGIEDPASGYTLTPAEKAQYARWESQGATLFVLGLIPFIVGASMEQQVTYADKPVGTFERNVSKDTALGKAVPMPNLMVTASAKNDTGTLNISGTTDQDGKAALAMDRLMSDVIATARELPQNTSVEIKAANGQPTYLYYNITEAIDIMSRGVIDWNTAPEGLTPYLEARMEIGGSTKASETVELKFHVSNQKGKGDCYRLQAMLKSEEPLFNRRILIGHIKAGQEISVSNKVEIPRLWQDRVIPLTVTFEELYKNIPDNIEARLVIEGLPRPALAYSYQIVDDGSGNSVGNSDGVAQKGEALDIEVTVNNTGAVAARDVQARISFASEVGEGVILQRNSLSLGDLAPNESKKGRFTLVVKKVAQINDININLNIDEKNLNVATADTIAVKIGAQTETKAIVMNPKPAYVTVDEITVRGGASPDSIARFRLKKDMALTITGQMGDWYRVDLGSGRNGWVSKNEIGMTEPKRDATAVAAPAAAATVIEVMQKAPPLIVLAQPQKSAVETFDDSIKIVGTAGDDRSVEKVDILVNNNLAKSLSTRGISVVERPKSSDEKTPSYSFEQIVSLNMGNNEIKIIAYDDEGLTRHQTIRVTRVPQRGETYMLSIGISNYDDQSIKKLPFAEEDAKSMADFYRNNPASPMKPENITTLYGKQATSRNIRKAIGDMSKKAKEYDTVILYYAGHGDVGKHPNKNTEYYLIPVDAEKEDLFSTAIELSEAQRLWSAVTSKRKVFIADACNSGGFSDLRGDVDGFEKGMGEGTIVMTASSRGQKAIEEPKLKHGLFTYFLLQGLAGAADTDGDKRVSISELKKFLDKEVPNKAKELGSAQTPVIKIETSGEIYLTR